MKFTSLICLITLGFTLSACAGTGTNERDDNVRVPGHQESPHYADDERYMGADFCPIYQSRKKLC